MGFGKNQGFMRFLAEQGLLPAPVPPPMMPADIARAHNLPTQDANIISQMYQDTRTPPPPPVPIQNNSYIPVDQQPLNAFLQSPAAQFLTDPAQLEQAINRYRLSPAGNPRPDMGSTGLFPAAGDLVVSGLEAVAPVVEQAPQAIKDRLFNPDAVVEDVKTVGEPVVDTTIKAYEYPLNTRKSATGEVLYKYAIGEDTGTMVDGQINWQGLWAINPQFLGLPVGFNPDTILTTPEKKAEVQNIYQTAEANGEDGGRAVWEWFIGQYSMIVRAFTEAGADPLNWTMALTPAGELAIAKGAIQGGKAGTGLKTVGQLLKAPEMIADAPFEVPAALYRGMGWGKRGASGVDASAPLVDDAAQAANQLIQDQTDAAFTLAGRRARGDAQGNPITRSSDAQLARDAEGEILRQAIVARDFKENPEYVNRAEAMTQQQSLARQAAIEAEAIARVNQGYTTGPGGAVQPPLTSAAAPPVSPTTPNPTTGPMPINPDIGPVPNVETPTQRVIRESEEVIRAANNDPPLVMTSENNPYAIVRDRYPSDMTDDQLLIVRPYVLDHLTSSRNMENIPIYTRMLGEIDAEIDRRGLSSIPQSSSANPGVMDQSVAPVDPGNPNDFPLVSDPGYAYHGTNVDNFYSIRESGSLDVFPPDYGTEDQYMWPDGSEANRSYWIEDPNGTLSFTPEGRPVIIRRKSDGLLRERGTRDLYATGPTPTSELEYLGSDGQWHGFDSPNPGVMDQPADIVDQVDQATTPTIRIGQTTTEVPEPSLIKTQADSDLPTLERVGTPGYTKDSRIVQQITSEQPQVAPLVARDMEQWTTDYESARNLLRTDELAPDQELARQAIPGAEPYQAKPDGRMTQEYIDYQGNNKALGTIYDYEFWGRTRFSTYINGGQVDNISFQVPEYLANNRIIDAQLVAKGVPPAKTRKGLTKESLIAHYMASRDPEASKLLADMLEEKGVFFVPGEGKVAVTDAEQRAAIRYQKAEAEKVLGGTPEELQAYADANGLQRQPVQVNPVDRAALPTTEDIIARGDAWTADRFDTVNRLPEEIQAEIYADISPWADEAYENIDIASPRSQVFTDLEFAARLREAAVRQGIALQVPSQSVPYEITNLDSAIRAAVQEPDLLKSDQIIQQLVDAGHMQYEAPNPYGYALTPSEWYRQTQAFDNYSSALDLRHRLHAPASELQQELAVRAGTQYGPSMSELPQYGPAVPPGPKKIPQKQYDERVQREIKKITKEWANDPTKGSPTSFDNLLAAAVEDFAIPESEAIKLRTKFRFNIGTKANPVYKETTVGDLFIEMSLKAENKTLSDAVRATNDFVAKAMRVEQEAPTNWGKGNRAFWSTYDKITKLWRDMYLYNPVSVVRNGLVDGITTSYVQMLEGHVKSGLKSFPVIPSVKTHYAFYKHNMDPTNIPIDAVLTMADNWGVKPGAGIVDVVTREFDDVAGKTAWSKVPGVGAVMDRGMAFRHGFDQINRKNLWGDEFGRGINAALHGRYGNRFTKLPQVDSFYGRVLEVMGGGEDALRAVDELKQLENLSGKNKGGFKASDVKQITGNAQLAKEWREITSSVGKAADAEVQRVLFSYRQTNADKYTRRVFMFHYWQSRALVQHTRLILSNPLLAYRYHQIWEGLDREANRQGIDGPLAPLQMYFEFMKGDGGMFGIWNPVAIATPYAMFSEIFQQQGGDMTTWDKTIGKVMFALPQVQAGLAVTGLSTRFPDALGTSAVRSFVRMVLDWDRNSGYNIFQLGPGITGDPVQDWSNKVIDAGNAMLRKLEPEIENIEVPDLSKSKQDVAANLIVEQAQEDWGVMYLDMTPAQKREVDAAIWAVRIGDQTNDRANEALAQMSDANMIAAGINTVLPGGMRARSEMQTDNQRAIDEYYDTGVQTPASENAFAVQDAVNSTPTATNLDLDTEALNNVGTEGEQIAYQAYNDIAYARDLDPMGYVEIAGKFFWGYEMNKMTDQQRLDLAQAWLLDNGYNMSWLDGYKARRDKVIGSSDVLPDYKQYQKDVGQYGGGSVYSYDNPSQRPDWVSGGVRAMRTDMEVANPNFGRAIQEKRAELQSQGLSGEELEKRLDIWAMGKEGYMAFSGIRADMRDPSPTTLQDASKVPPDLGGSQEQSYSSSSSSSSSADEPREMPDYQKDLIAENNAYQAAIQTFEAEYGPITNYSQHPLVVERALPVPSRDLVTYLNWQKEQIALGLDGSMDAYIRFRNEQYDNRKKEQSGENKTVQELLAGVQ